MDSSPFSRIGGNGGAISAARTLNTAKAIISAREPAKNFAQYVPP